MKKRYITFNTTLIKGIEDLGFKRKNKYDFRKELNDGLTCKLVFASYGIRPHITTYYILIHITIPGLAESAEWIKSPNPHGDTNVTELGSLLPEKRFLFWDISNEAPEEEDVPKILDMINQVKHYAVPYVEQFSTEEGIIRGIIGKTYGNGLLGGKYLCPYYLFLKGYNREAIKYIEDHKRQLLKSYEEDESKDYHWYETYVEITNQIYQKYNVTEEEIKKHYID